MEQHYPPAKRLRFHVGARFQPVFSLIWPYSPCLGPLFVFGGGELDRGEPPRTPIYTVPYTQLGTQMQAWSIVVDGKRSIFLTPLKRSAQDTYLFLSNRFGSGRVSSVKPVGEKNCQTKPTPSEKFIPL